MEGRFSKFFFIFIIIALAFDYGLTRLAPVEKSNLFWKNDYERIAACYGTTTFDKAFYGNSAVIASYIDSQSQSGYVNIAIDYGTVLDLYKMLDEGFIDIESELVIGLNFFCFLDTLDTNPTYPWHRRPYEPYLYFQRDRIYPLLEEGLKRALRGEDFVENVYVDFKRSVYYGIMTDEELTEKANTHRELFWNLGVENYSENLNALDKLLELCFQRDIKVRALWMPWNSKIPVPSMVLKVQEKANEVFNSWDVEVKDMTSSVESGMFHDIGHLEYTTGAPYFTELLSPWLG